MDLSVMPNCRVVQMKEEFSSNFGGVGCSQMFWGRCSDVMPLLDGAKIFPNPWNTDSKVTPLFWSVRFPPENLTRAPLWTLQTTYSLNAQIHREDGLRSWLSSFHGASEHFWWVRRLFLRPSEGIKSLHSTVFATREFFSATSLSWWTLSRVGFCWS